MSSVTIDPRYPIGEYVPKPFSIEQKIEWLADIKFLPLQLENAILNLDEAQLQTPYREDGWTVHQLVHHVADSHMNAYIRFKTGLTEDNPTIKPYEEAKWAELADGNSDNILPSIQIIEGVHSRWVLLLKSFGEKELKKQFIHPANNKTFCLDEIIGLYAWHCNHHLAHITELIKRKNWR